MNQLDISENYEIINYINDVSLENPEVLMTSDADGNYKTGPGTEFNQIKKWGDRGFE